MSNPYFNPYKTPLRYILLSLLKKRTEGCKVYLTQSRFPHLPRGGSEYGLGLHQSGFESGFIWLKVCAVAPLQVALPLWETEEELTISWAATLCQALYNASISFISLDAHMFLWDKLKEA